MKKFRIKEEAKKFIHKRFHGLEMSVSDWKTNSNNTVGEEALEEVEERIEVKKVIIRKDILTNRKSTDRELQLCEAILNASESTKEAVLKGDKIDDIYTLLY